MCVCACVCLCVRERERVCGTHSLKGLEEAVKEKVPDDFVVLEGRNVPNKKVSDHSQWGWEEDPAHGRRGETGGRGDNNNNISGWKRDPTRAWRALHSVNKHEERGHVLHNKLWPLGVRPSFSSCQLLLSGDWTFSLLFPHISWSWCSHMWRRLDLETTCGWIWRLWEDETGVSCITNRFVAWMMLSRGGGVSTTHVTKNVFYVPSCTPSPPLPCPISPRGNFQEIKKKRSTDVQWRWIFMGDFLTSYLLPLTVTWVKGGGEKPKSLAREKPIKCLVCPSIPGGSLTISMGWFILIWQDMKSCILYGLRVIAVYKYSDSASRHSRTHCRST